MRPNESDAPLLSIVVGTYNRLSLLRKCAASVFAQTSVPFQMLVTDAGSTDGTIAFLESMRSEKLVPVFVGSRLGQARAYNDLFTRVTTPFVCWLSDDNQVVNASLDLAVEILTRDPAIGMVALKVKDTAGPNADAPYIGGISSTGILNVNQGVLRTALLQQVGGFSEDFRDYGIDADLTARVLTSGHDIVYTRHIGLLHERAWVDDERETSARAERQQRHRRLYHERYGLTDRFSPGWQAKMLLWKVLRRILGMGLSSPGAILGLTPRDWHNVLMARYVSILDPIRSRGKPYHLRQTWKEEWRSRPPENV